MLLGIPVVDGQDLTMALLKSLSETVTGDNFKVVIIDNGSKQQYYAADYYVPFPLEVIRFETNQGFYCPLEELYNRYDDECIGLIHNDMVIYERGWNERMEKCFKEDEKLALVGLCGSSEIDERGGRGGGTVCYFRGAEVAIGDKIIKGQDQAAGRRTTDLVPSGCLDSLFMMFKRGAIPDLVTEADPWKDITLAHFYDRIWPVRLVEAGWHVATLGVECDHLGGMTTAGNMRYRDDCIRWLDERGIVWRIGKDNKGQVIAAETFDARNIPNGNPETEMYLVAERRYLNEYRDTKHFIPLRIGGDYVIRH